MRDNLVDGRSRGRGNRGHVSGRFLNNRNGIRGAEGISRAMNAGTAFVQDHTGSTPRAGGAFVESAGNLDRVSVRGWVTSKAGTDPDRGAQSVLNFLARKATPTEGLESGNELIQKVCLKPLSAGHERLSNFKALTGRLSLQTKHTERRLRYSNIAATARG